MPHGRFRFSSNCRWSDSVGITTLEHGNERKFKDGQETVLKMFADLISYMKNQDSRFQTIFVGCISFEPGQRQQRLGIKKLLDAILPRG